MTDQNVQAFEVSAQQARLWALHQAGGSYWSRCVVRIEGALDTAALEAALADVVQAHEILRTTFRRPAGLKVPYQVIADDGAVDWNVDGSGSTGADPDAIEQVLGTALAPHDVAEGPALRAQLAETQDGAHLLTLSAPALVLDGPSMPSLVGELAAAYGPRLRGESRSDEPMQYVDFADWEAELREGGDGSASTADPGTLDLVSLPGRSEGGAAPPAEVGRKRATLGSDVMAAVDDLVGEGVSRDDVFAAAWVALAARLTGTSEVLVGEVCDGRLHENLHGVLGPYSRVLPGRYDIGSGRSFARIVTTVAATRRELCRSQYLHVWPEPEPESDPTGCALGFETRVAGAPVDAEGARFVPLAVDGACDRFDLRLVYVDSDERPALELIHDPGRYDSESTARLLGYYQVLLTAAVASPETLVGALPMIGPAERAALIDTFNDTAADLDSRSVHQLFEARAAECPDRLSVVADGVSLTYRELDRRANAVAHKLRACGVGPEVGVGIHLPRSVEWVVAMLGVMKSGGFYVPLDTTLPPRRVGTLVAGADVRVVLTDAGSSGGPLAEALAGLEVDVLTLPDPATDRSAAAPVSGVEGGHRAYVVFTSGSTGTPKGVGVEHRNLSNYTLAVAERIGCAPASRFATVSTLAADLGHTAIFPALAGGGTLHVVPEDRLGDPDALADYVAEHRIDVLKIVPSFLDVLLSAASPERVIPLRTLIVGGEASSWALVGRVGSLSPATAVLNHYGPTETTVGALTFGARDGKRTTENLPIGSPLANARAYVVDAFGNPLPAGVTGELYVGGAGVARGYVGAPGQTAERFVPDASSGESGARVYRTGDLARHLPNSGLEFRGRADHQVKIRGYRVELGEIEAGLQRAPGITSAAVVLRGEALAARLVAYVVGDGSVPDVVTASEGVLREALPDYMVPDAWVELPRLPLTSNGKVDRAALPEPAAVSGPATGSLVEPRSPEEAEMAALWADLLDVDAVGVEDDFFDIGGHSLLAMRLILRVRQTFGVDLQVHSLFEEPTVAGLVRRLGRAGDTGTERPPLVRVSREEPLPLSFAQHRLWFLDQMDPGGIEYNRPAALRLAGTLDVIALEHALREVVRRHEVMRTTFRAVDGDPVQVVSDEADLAISIADLSGLDATTAERETLRLASAEAMRPFDLADGPLARAVVLSVAAAKHVLLLTEHHIISDAWSNEVLVREVSALYRAFTAGTPSSLGELEIQYADYAVWQRAWLAGAALDEQLAYWRDRLDPVAPPLELPTDRPRPATQSFRGAMASVEIDQKLAERLDALARDEGATLFMVLLGAFQLLLHRYSGQEGVSVGAPIAGRNQPEIEGLVGFFVNTLIFRTELGGGPSFRELLARVRDVSLGAYKHQDVPFERLVEESRPERDLSRSMLFQSMFIFQNAPIPEVDMPGVRSEPLAPESGPVRSDIDFYLWNTGDGMSGTFVYAADLFDARTVERMTRRFVTLLESIVAHPDTPISELDLDDPIGVPALTPIGPVG